MLYVSMLSVLILSITMQNTVSLCSGKNFYECCNAEFHYVECCYAECHYAECRYTVCRFAECCYAQFSLCWVTLCWVSSCSVSTYRMPKVNECSVYFMLLCLMPLCQCRGAINALFQAAYPQTGNPYWWGRFSMADLLIKLGCFVEKKNIASAWKEADLNWLVQGGQPYWTFPFHKDSLLQNFRRLLFKETPPLLIGFPSKILVKKMSRNKMLRTKDSARIVRLPDLWKFIFFFTKILSNN
jgi:hypothetical protein